MGMPVIKGSDTKQCQALIDILESIALEEAAIAHVINAEGEKIQKVVKECDVSIHELLEINRSVEEVIEKFVSLESVLTDKLEIVKCMLNDINKCDCERGHHEHHD